MALGYDQGNPFGDPNHFTRSTGEDEINRFNEWMRTQPFWQQARGTGTGDFNPAQEQQISDGLRSQGVNLPGAFHIDEGGNLNQKSRTKRNLIIAGMIGAGALTGGAALGAFGGAGAVGAGGAAAGAGGAGAAGAAGAGTLASTAIGSGFIPAIAGGTGLAGAGAAGAGIGGAALTAAGGSGMRGALGTIGRVATGAEQGRAGGRLAEQGANSQYDRSRLDAAKLNLEAPGMRAQNSVRGDILANAQPLSITGPITHTGGKMPTISGGLSPALLSDNTRSLGKDMSRQALMSQMAGDFQPTPQPKSNGVDTALNIAGTAGAVGDVMAPVLRRIPQIAGWF